jgi:hypothetical protein
VTCTRARELSFQGRSPYRVRCFPNRSARSVGIVVHLLDAFHNLGDQCDAYSRDVTLSFLECEAKCLQGVPGLVVGDPQ